MTTEQSSAKRSKRFNQKHHPVMWAIIVIDLLIVFVPVIVLFLWCVAGRWTYPNLIPEEFSLRGFETVFEMNPDILWIIGSSILLSLIVAAISMVISFLAARAIALYRFPGRRVMDYAALLPLMVSATALGMGIHVFMLQQGWANNFVGVILVHLFIVIPYGIKMLVDPIAIMGTTYAEQARNLGANSLQSFFHVELAPLLPSVVSAMSLSFIVSFSQYFLTLIIGGGKVVTLAMIMVPWVGSADRTLAATYAVIYLVATLVMFVLFVILGKIVSRNRKNYLL